MWVYASTTAYYASTTAFYASENNKNMKKIWKLHKLASDETFEVSDQWKITVR
jgi:hypothetical protein